MTGRGRRAIVGVLVMVASACSGGSDGGSESTEPTAAVADHADLTLDGPVDAVIRMQPGAPGRPPDALVAGNTVLSARRVLQAPGGEKGPVDLWLMRVKDPRGVVMLCRFVTDRTGSGGGSCTDGAQDPAADGSGPTIQIGASSDGVEVVYDFDGPDDLTHYVVTLDGRRLAVVPIEGDAILRFDDGCGANGTVTAWRGDVQVDEQPLSSMC